MDTDKLQQTNSFIKGMNIDFADGYLDDEQYRFARNLRLTADKKSNSGELNLIEGVTEYNVTYNNRPIDCTEILATASIRNYGIIVTKTEKEPKNSYWIYIRPNGNNVIVSYPQKENGSTSVCQAEITLKFTIQVKDSVSGALKNSAVVINIPEGTLTTNAENSYKVSDHEIHALYGPYICTADDYENKYNFVFDPIVDLQYHVTINEINATWCIYRFNNDDGVATRVFGPCMEPLWNQDGNYKLSTVTRWESDQNVKLYIADGVHGLMTFNIAEDNGTLISNVSKVDSIYLPKIETQIDEDTNGNLKPAVVQYTYQLYNKYGISTTMAPLSVPQNIYEKHRNIIGIPYGTPGNISIKLTIPVISDNSFRKIKIYRITYEQNGSQPTVEVIHDATLKDQKKEFTLTDSGLPALETLQASELSSLSGLNIKPTSIESKENYLFASNIGYKEDDIYYDWNATENVTVDLVYKENQDLNNKSLQRGEIYRYGIVLYNENGIKSAAKWIADIKVPSAQENNFVKYENGELKYYAAGIKVTVNNLPESCSGYEIVRCERTVHDSTIVMQGLLSNTILCSSDKSDFEDYYSSSPVISLDNYSLGWLEADGRKPILNYNTHAQSSQELFTFISPEISYQADDIQSILDSNEDLYIEVLAVYTNADVKSHGNESYGVRYELDRDDQFAMLDVYSDDESKRLKYSVHSKGDKYYKFIGSGPYNIQGGSRPLKIIHFDRSVAFANATINGNSEIYFPNNNYSIYKFNTVPSKWIENTTEDKNTFITHAKLPQLYEWNELYDDEGKTNIGTKLTSIDQYNYDNITYGSLSAQISEDGVVPLEKLDVAEDLRGYGSTYYGVLGQLMGPNGKQMLLKLEKVPAAVSELYKGSTTAADASGFKCCLCNIKRKPSYPYMGESDVAKQNSIYLSNGFYFPSTTEGTSVEVYDGDVYIGQFEHLHMTKWWDKKQLYGSKSTSIYYIPVESRINFSLAHGTKFTDIYDTSNSGWIQYKPASITAKMDVQDNNQMRTINYTQTKPMYQYNTAYSAPMNAVMHSAELIDHSSSQYDCRIHYSNPKLNNEIIDSWQTFAPANFLDVDTRFGEITGLRLFKDKLIYWQENAMGVLSVNERSLITDASNAELILGTGDVLSRYDYITTSYGMKKDQYCDAQSKDRLYWWDYHKKDLCALDGGQCVSLSDTKNVRSYTDSSTLNENPILTYDSENNELLACVCKDESLVYSEQVEGFTGVYELKPTDYIQFNDSLLLLDGKDIFKYNTSVDKKAYGFKNSLTPSIEFIVNKYTMHNKVFDNQIINMTFDDKDHIRFTYKTPLNQEGSVMGDKMRDFECNYKLAIPRHKNSEYGDRLRGKTMSCTISSMSNSTDFSIQSVLTKFRISL